jgi:SAM-dependent methyltransferase
MEIHHPWTELRGVYERTVGEMDKHYTSATHAEQDRRFILERFTEGTQVARFLRGRLGDGPLRILDVGTGNAGVAVALANVIGNRVVALDHAFNRDVRSLIRDSRLPLDYVVASGATLPLSDASFDVVLCLETIEHVRDATDLGSEIMRVLDPGGLCVVTTPARVRFLLRRDPHFGIPGLLLLPDHLQRVVATRIARVVPPNEYDVHHIYWYAGSLARLFPGRDAFQAIGDPPHNPVLRKLWSLSQRFVWERCIVRKLPAGTGATSASTTLSS